MYITAPRQEENRRGCMDRSRFLSFLGTSASLPLAGPEGETGPIGNDIDLGLVKVYEQAAVESLPEQQPDGGLRDEHEILQPEATASFLLSLTALFPAPSRATIAAPNHACRMSRCT